MSKVKEQFDAMAKIAVIGDSAVGKTSMLLRYVSADYQPNHLATVGIDFKVKTVNVEGFKIKTQIWDTAGQERFRNLTSTIYQGAEAIILTYSVDNKISFANVTRWMEDIKNYAKPKTIVALVANKIDLDDHLVTAQEGKALADKIGAVFFQTSAKNNSNINELFQSLAALIKDKIVTKDRITPHVNTPTDIKPNVKLDQKQPKKNCQC